MKTFLCLMILVNMVMVFKVILAMIQIKFEEKKLNETKKLNSMLIYLMSKIANSYKCMVEFQTQAFGEYEDEEEDLTNGHQ